MLRCLESPFLEFWNIAWCPKALQSNPVSMTSNLSKPTFRTPGMIQKRSEIDKVQTQKQTQQHKNPHQSKSTHNLFWIVLFLAVMVRCWRLGRLLAKGIASASWSTLNKLHVSWMLQIDFSFLLQVLRLAYSSNPTVLTSCAIAAQQRSGRVVNCKKEQCNRGRERNYYWWRTTWNQRSSCHFHHDLKMVFSKRHAKPLLSHHRGRIIWFGIYGFVFKTHKTFSRCWTLVCWGCRYSLPLPFFHNHVLLYSCCIQKEFHTRNTHTADQAPHTMIRDVWRQQLCPKIGKQRIHWLPRKNMKLETQQHVVWRITGSYAGGFLVCWVTCRFARQPKVMKEEAILDLKFQFLYIFVFWRSDDNPWEENVFLAQLLQSFMGDIFYLISSELEITHWAEPFCKAWFLLVHI